MTRALLYLPDAVGNMDRFVCRNAKADDAEPSGFVLPNDGHSMGDAITGDPINDIPGIIIDGGRFDCGTIKSGHHIGVFGVFGKIQNLPFAFLILDHWEHRVILVYFEALRNISWIILTDTLTSRN